MLLISLGSLVHIWVLGCSQLIIETREKVVLTFLYLCASPLLYLAQFCWVWKLRFKEEQCLVKPLPRESCLGTAHRGTLELLPPEGEATLNCSFFLKKAISDYLNTFSWKDTHTNQTNIFQTRQDPVPPTLAQPFPRPPPGSSALGCSTPPLLCLPQPRPLQASFRRVPLPQCCLYTAREAILKVSGQEGFGEAADLDETCVPITEQAG